LSLRGTAPGEAHLAVQEGNGAGGDGPRHSAPSGFHASRIQVQFIRDRKGKMPYSNRVTIISEYPRLNINILNNHKITDGLFKSYYGKDAHLFYLGRGALFHAIKLLHLADTDNILVPSYHCGVDIESVSMAGAQIRYYKINNNMEVDITDLIHNIDTNTKAVLITHYFGFPQSIDELRIICQEKGLFLIEDCAHALFSICQGKALGSFGDIAIFSQRKSLPIADGGALLINNSKLALSSQRIKPNQLVSLKQTIGMVYNSLVHRSNVKLLQLPVKFIKDKINGLIRKEFGGKYSTGMEIDSDICNLAMSNISESIMNRSKIDIIIQIRRYNFKYLLDNFPNSQHIKVVYTKLSAGVCPLFFPVQVEDISRREVQDTLRQYGVHTYIFGENLHGSLPGDKFPDAEMLSRQILCLPVHQNLKGKDLKLILHAINSICSQE
jgi:perosamine synthetase